MLGLKLCATTAQADTQHVLIGLPGPDHQRAQAWPGLSGRPPSYTSLKAQPIPYLDAACSQLHRIKGNLSAEAQAADLQVSPVYPGPASSSGLILVHRDILELHCPRVAVAVACGRSNLSRVMQPHV